jgi:DNA replication protein DnaC
MPKPDFKSLGNKLAEEIKNRKPEPLHCRRCKDLWTPLEKGPQWADEDGERWTICAVCGFGIAQEKTGIRERYRGARLEMLSDADRLFLERAAVKGGYVWGDPGVGKTFGLSAVANKKIVQTLSPTLLLEWDGFRARWATAKRSLVKCLFSGREESAEEHFLRVLGDRKFLLFDEVLSSRVLYSDQDERLEFKAFFAAVVDRLYSGNAVVLFGSNLSLQRVAEDLDRKVAERIYEMVGGREGYYQMVGPNRRAPKGKS